MISFLNKVNFSMNPDKINKYCFVKIYLFLTSSDFFTQPPAISSHNFTKLPNGLFTTCLNIFLLFGFSYSAPAPPVAAAMPALIFFPTTRFVIASDAAQAQQCSFHCTVQQWSGCHSSSTVQPVDYPGPCIPAEG